MNIKLEANVHDFGYREFKPAQRNDGNLGRLSRLPGKWINAKEGVITGFEGRGWNMIALPFFKEGNRGDFRVLANQYNETLDFMVVDGPVPNRGVEKTGLDPATAQTDQTIFGLDYTQRIAQIAVGDSPETGEDVRGRVGAGIHHEPGFMLWIQNQHSSVDFEVRTPDATEPSCPMLLDVARLASIPHGDAVTAMGVSFTRPGAPFVPEISGLPVQFQSPPGQPDPTLDRYLTPYAALSGANKFEGLFDVSRPWELLRGSIASLGTVIETTTLHFNTTFATGGIVNIPFIVAEANATQMQAIFWIMELETPINGRKWVLAYIQNVMLDFFDFPGDPSQKIRWPHVSINVMCLDEAPAQQAVHKPERMDMSNE